MADGNMSEKIRALKEQIKAYEDKMASEGKIVSHDRSWMDEIKPKRGRGRPRKVVTTEQPKRGRGRPRKVVDPTIVQQKRGRGRPRKIVDPTIAAMPKRGRGRPRKVVDPAAATMPKRGRGRPRKYPVGQEPYKQPQNVQPQIVPAVLVATAPQQAEQTYAPQQNVDAYQQQPVQSAPSYEQTIQPQQPVYQQPSPQPVVSEEIDDSIDDDVEDVDFDDILGQLDALGAETEDEEDSEDATEDAETADEPLMTAKETPVSEPYEQDSIEPENVESTGEIEEPISVNEDIVEPVDEEPVLAEESITEPNVEDDEDMQPSVVMQDEVQPALQQEDDKDLQPTAITQEENQSASSFDIDQEETVGDEEMQPTMMSEDEQNTETIEDDEPQQEMQPAITQEENEPEQMHDTVAVVSENVDDKEEIAYTYTQNMWDENGDIPYFTWLSMKQKELTPIGYKKLDGGEKVDDNEVLNAVVKKVFSKNARVQGTKILVPVVFAIAGVAGGYFLSNGLLGGDYLWYSIGGGAAGGAVISSAITCAFGGGVNAMLKSPEILRWKINNLNERARKVLETFDSQKEKHLRKAKSFVKKKFAIFEEEAYGIYKNVKSVLNEIEKKKENNFYDADAKKHSRFIKKYRISMAKIANKFKYVKLNESYDHIKILYNEILDDTQSFGSFLEATRLKNKIKTNNFFENAKSGTLKKPKKVVEKVNKETKQKEFVIPQLPEKEFNILRERIPYYIEQCTDKHGRINAKQVFEDADRVFGADVNLKARFLTRAFNNDTFVINDDNVFKVAKDVLLYPEYADLVDSGSTANDFKTGVKKLSDSINSSPSANNQLMKFQEKLDPMFKEIFKRNYAAVMQTISEIEEEKETEKEQQSIVDEIREERKKEDDELFIAWEKQYLETLDAENKAIYEGMDFADKQELKKNVLAAIHKEMGDEFEDEEIEQESVKDEKPDDDSDEDGDSGLKRLPQLDDDGNFIEQTEPSLVDADASSLDEIAPSLESDIQPTIENNDTQLSSLDDIQPSIQKDAEQFDANDNLQPSIDEQQENGGSNETPEPLSNSDGPSPNMGDSLDDLPSLPQVDENGNLIE